MAQLDDDGEHPVVTVRETRAWCWFDFATQPFCSAAVTIFIPLILEDLAWRAGVTHDGRVCGDRTELTPDQLQAADCQVAFMGMLIKPVSFALYVFSISVALQVLFFISFGAFADHSRYRKLLMTVFTMLTAGLAIAFTAVVSPAMYNVAAVLTILANVSYGCSVVFYYSYLPVLVDREPRVIEARLTIKLEDSESNDTLSSDGGLSDDELMSTDTNKKVNARLSAVYAEDDAAMKVNDVKDMVSNEISTYGAVWGQFGAVVVLIICGILLLTIPGADKMPYLMNVFVAGCGAWILAFYFAFTLPGLKTRPGPPLPASEWSFITYSWKKTIGTFRKAYKLKNTFLMLVSWFFYSDGFNTIGSVAILFGKSLLNMKDDELLYIAVIAPVMAMIGAWMFYEVLYKRMGLSSKTVVFTLLVLVAVVPAYGLIGFVTNDSTPIGIHTAAELYIVAAYYGFLCGAVQSFSRSYFSELIPPSMEAEFFALYEISDKGSCWLGPLLVAVLTDHYGSIRYGFFAIMGLLLVAMVPLAMVNTRQGKDQARKYRTLSQ